MTETPTEIVLHRVDPARNMARFYRLSIEPNLFGGSSLVRNWGRIGAPGQSKLEFFDDDDATRCAMGRIARRKLARGYGSPAA